MKSACMTALIILLLVTAAISSAGEFDDFSKDSQLQDLSAPVRCFFDAAAQNDRQALMACYADDTAVTIAGMKFNGPDEVVDFAERDTWGGKYKVEKVFKQDNAEIVHCRFWPKGWSSPEPPIEYRFKIQKGQIIDWQGKYR